MCATFCLRSFCLLYDERSLKEFSISQKYLIHLLEIESWLHNISLSDTALYVYLFHYQLILHHSE